MKTNELTAIIRGIAPAFRAHIAEVRTRLAALEVKERGIDGAPGPIGPQGPDGTPGRDGRDGLAGVPGWPGEKGADGAPGKDGRDGTLENLKMERVDDRTVRFCFKDGTPIEGGTLTFPVVIYRDVFGLDGRKSYERGDSVTFGNQQWIAMEDTSEKPGQGKAWRLAVRKGQDGREGKQGIEGPKGRDGKDATPVGYRP